MRIDIKYVAPGASLLVFGVFTHFYLNPHKIDAHSAVIHGVANHQVASSELTSIAQMPFLSYRNEQLSVGNMTISDDIFSLPISQPSVQEVEIEKPVDVEDFAPVEVKIKPDYAQWAGNNLKLQAITSLGAIINNTFYPYGRELNVIHSFEDGTNFSGKLVSASGKSVHVLINGEDIVEIQMRKFP